MYILMINISHKLFQVSKIRKSDRILGYTRYPQDPPLISELEGYCEKPGMHSKTDLTHAH